MSNAGSTTAAGNASTGEAKQKKKYTGQERVIARPTAYDFGSKKDGGKGAKVSISFVLESGSHAGDIFSWFGVLNEENEDQFNRCIDALVHCGATDSLDVDSDDRLVGFGAKRPTLTMGDTKNAKGEIEYGIVFVNGGTPMANALNGKETKSLIGGLAQKLADRAAAKRSGRASSSASAGDDGVLRDEDGNEIPI